MPIESKFSKEVIAKFVKRHAQGESVHSLIKEAKISRAGFYLWVRKARQEAMAKPLSATDERIHKDLRLSALQQENDALRRRLVDLMLKHGEI